MRFLSKIRILFSKKDIFEYQQQLLNTHYQEVENMYRDIRKFRHNYRNHLQTLRSFVAENDMESIKNYLDNLDENLHSIAPVIRTGNRMADAILNSKITTATNENIKCIADCKISNILDIKDIDLATIIGNLFDNAIESVRNLPEEDRFIRIYMDMKGNKLYISFTNKTSSKKQEKFGRIFKSTKGENRGLGLISIDEIVDKYDGYINRNSEDNAFTTEILI